MTSELVYDLTVEDGVAQVWFVGKGFDPATDDHTDGEVDDWCDASEVPPMAWTLTHDGWEMATPPFGKVTP